MCKTNRKTSQCSMDNFCCLKLFVCYVSPCDDNALMKRLLGNSQGSGAKSYMTIGLLNEEVVVKIFVHFLTSSLCTRSHLNFFIYVEYFVFFFITVFPLENHPRSLSQ
jgi:hypothetical protein